MRRAAAPLLGALLLLLVGWAGAALAQQPAFPRLTGRVVDEAGVLDAAAESGLARDLEAHERATGQQVVVATLRSLQGLAVEEFANRLFREWRLGGAERDDGALLVVAPQERKVRIEVGYGLEGVLTDAASATIIQSLILPRFRAGDLQGGILAGARGILELLRPEDGASGDARQPGWAGSRRPQQAAPTLPVVPVLFAFVFLILLMRLLGRRGGRGPDGQRTPRRRGFGYGYPPVIVFPGGFGRGGGGFGGGEGGGFSGGGGSSGGGGASGSW